MIVGKNIIIHYFWNKENKKKMDESFYESIVKLKVRRKKTIVYVF